MVLISISYAQSSGSCALIFSLGENRTVEVWNLMLCNLILIIYCSSHIFYIFGCSPNV
jgi:hypothetical protein